MEFDASENFDVELIDAMNFSLKDLESSPPDTINALIVAVYGEGEPTDNAKKFMKQVMSMESDLSTCKYAVFGLGNSYCFKDRFNIVGKQLDKKLSEHGAQRIIDIGLGDANKNQTAEFSAWKKRLLDELQNLNVDDSTAATTPAPSITSRPPVGSGRTNSPPSEDPLAVDQSSTIMSPNSHVPLVLSPRQQAMAPEGRPIFFSRVAGLRQMFTKTDEINSSVLVSYDVSAPRLLNPAEMKLCPSDSPCGLGLSKQLKPGDHIGVFAPQANHVVETFATAANIPQSALDKPWEGVTPTVTTTLRQVLTWQIQLTGVVPVTAIKVLHRWSSENKMRITATHLQTLIDDYNNLVHTKGVGVATLLDMIPLGPTFPPLPLVALLKALPAISPRLYSMVQTPVADSSFVSMLCRLLRYRDARSCIVSGLCSSYLAERVHIDDEAAIFFRESNFHLPEDPKQPVIMIAGGTGISPFMAFLQERSRIAKKLGKENLGPAVLFFGCRNSDEYMFREQLLQNLADKSLSKLVVSFSSRYDESELPELNGHPNEIIKSVIENITDSVNADRDAMVKLVKLGGSMYVCGGAGNFGKAVRHAVEGIVDIAYPPDHARSSEDVNGVRKLIQQKRYFEDLAD